MKYLGSFLLILTFAGVSAYAAGEQKKVKEVPVKLSGTTDGAQLYREHCAVCHGVAGKGDGPAASALKRMPTDLTKLAAASGGKYPALAVQQKLRAGDIQAHGTIDMPIWGRLLTPAGGSRVDAEMRIYALVEHIEKIQGK